MPDLHKPAIAREIIINLTVTDTSHRKIPETIVINIHKTPIMEMGITGIINGIKGIMKMIMDIIKRGETGIEERWGETNMIIHTTTKEVLKIIPIETGTGTGDFIGCLKMVTEINNSSYINPTIVGFIIS